MRPDTAAWRRTSAPDSTQGSILLTSRSTSTEPIRVTDASGSVLAEFAPAKAYNCVIVSTPALKQGSTYTVTMGGESTDVTLDSLIYGSGGIGGGMGGQPGGNHPPAPPPRHASGWKRRRYGRHRPPETAAKAAVPDNKSASFLPPR
ncbi:MAG: hypothetical protein V8S57_02685 [Oscillospiraceae bacterium]